MYGNACRNIVRRDSMILGRDHVQTDLHAIPERVRRWQRWKVFSSWS